MTKLNNTEIGLFPKAVDAQMGDHFKEIERNSRLVEFVPHNKAFVIRVDGRAFHTFARGMEKPFSQPLDDMRAAGAQAVLESLKPNFAYFQSDEISYVWMPTARPEQIHPFHGRVDKLITLCASLTSVAFYREYVLQCSKSDATAGSLPHFDGRIAGVFDSPEEAIRCVQWRENDAMRNSVQMLAQSLFSHKQLQKKSVYEQFRMCDEIGHNWFDRAPEFRRGTYVRRATELVELTEEQRQKIPEAHRPAAGTKVPRSVFKNHFFDDWDIPTRLEALVG